MGIFSDEDVDSALKLLDDLIEKIQQREKQDKEVLDESKIKEIRKTFLERFKQGLDSVKAGANVPPSAIFQHLLNGILKDTKRFGVACGFLAGTLKYNPKQIIRYPNEFMQIMAYLIKNPDYKAFIVKRLLKWKNIMLKMKEKNELTSQKIEKFEVFSYEIGLG